MEEEAGGHISQTTWKVGLWHFKWAIFWYCHIKFDFPAPTPGEKSYVVGRGRSSLLILLKKYCDSLSLESNDTRKGTIFVYLISLLLGQSSEQCGMGVTEECLLPLLLHSLPCPHYHDNIKIPTIRNTITFWGGKPTWFFNEIWERTSGLSNHALLTSQSWSPGGLCYWSCPPFR